MRIITRSPGAAPPSMPRSTAPHYASPYLLLSLASFLWAFNWIIGRAMVGHVTPVALTFARWTVAFAAMLPFAWPQLRAHAGTLRKHWRRIAWLAFWGTGIQNVFGYVGLQYTTATNGVMLNSAIPVMIIVTGWLVYGDTITRLQSVGVAVSLAGVLAILTRGDVEVLLSLSLNRGDLIVLGGLVFWAVYSVILRTKPPGLPGLALLAACSGFGVLFLAPLAAFEALFLGGHIEVAPATVAAILYIGVFPSFVGYISWNRGVAEVGANVAGIFLHLMPAFGALLAWLFLDERIHAYHIAGIGLVLAGIALSARGERAVPAAAPE